MKWTFFKMGVFSSQNRISQCFSFFTAGLYTLCFDKQQFVLAVKFEKIVCVEYKLLAKKCKKLAFWKNVFQN